MTQQFDFGRLQSEFKKICHDYGDDLYGDTSSNALSFSDSIIYKLGPENHQRVKNGQPDEVYKIRFPYTTTIPATDTEPETTARIEKVAFVSTSEADECVHNATNEYMVLTIKQASLLAVTTLCKCLDYTTTFTPPAFILTPLAGAAYSACFVKCMARKLQMTPTEVIKAINASCLDGGQYLPESDVTAALAGAIGTSSRIKNEARRLSILRKIVQQYFTAGKEWDSSKFFVYATYVTGYTLPEMMPEVLIRRFEEVQSLRIRRENNEQKYELHHSPPRAPLKSSGATYATGDYPDLDLKNLIKIFEECQRVRLCGGLKNTEGIDGGSTSDKETDTSGNNSGQSSSNEIDGEKSTTNEQS